MRPEDGKRMCTNREIKKYKNNPKLREKFRKIRYNQILENFGQCSPNYNPNSIPIIEAKAEELGIMELMHAENGGEFYIKGLGY